MTVCDSVPIALVRHGETDWNLDRRIQGRTDIPLNETGRQQAREISQILAAHGSWRGVRASPLGRASETAQIIAAGLKLDAPAVDERFWERDFGEAEGLAVSDAQQRWPGLDSIPGAESLEDLRARTATALLQVLIDAPGTIVVAHGAMLRAGMAHATGAEVPRVLNGEVWLMYPSGGQARLERLAAPASAIVATAAQR